ncbi:iga [Symbiodinium natans]|uniref:Iga protein n=1 Tax=Symbiodinium natans TaxID=878477 RepID=A0A812R0K6_9DINO|nr:iga [Symbiodinium natans]
MMNAFRKMGAVCSALVQDKVEDVEPCSIKSASIGVESEPLWKQMAEAQIELRKAAEATRPEVEKQLAERAAARQASAKKAEAERKATEAKLKELERRQREDKEKADKEKAEKEKAPKKRTEEAKSQLPSGKAKPKSKASGGAAEQAANPSQLAKLTKDQAKDALNRAVAIFDMPENRRKLQEAVSSCHGDDAKKMAVLMPLVQGMLKDLLESHGFTADKILHAVMQISTHAQGDKKKLCCRRGQWAGHGWTAGLAMGMSGLWTHNPREQAFRAFLSACSAHRGLCSAQNASCGANWQLASAGSWCKVY